MLEQEKSHIKIKIVDMNMMKYRYINLKPLIWNYVRNTFTIVMCFTETFRKLQ